MSSRYLIVTDRQTDGQTKAISIPRYALVHRAVKMIGSNHRNITISMGPTQRAVWRFRTTAQVKGPVYPISQVRGVTCHMGSQCYLPPYTSEHTLP